MTNNESLIFDSTPDASVVITTRQRCHDLHRALRSCELQVNVAIEILVYDDASDDGTEEMVRREFPNVRYFRQPQQTGYIVLRNRGFKDAKSPFVISIDDDAWFSSPEIVSNAIGAFTEFDGTAAFAIRYIEPNRKISQGFMEDLPRGALVRNFIGCAHIIRRSVALELNGYREFFEHQGEERDLCLRLLNHGFDIRYLSSAPIVHEPNPVRDDAKLAYTGLRNTFLFDILNIPFPDVIFRLAKDVILLIRHKITLKALPRRLWYTLKGLAACLTNLYRRKPVSRKTYNQFKLLPKSGAVFQGDFPNLEGLCRSDTGHFESEKAQ